MSHSATSRVQEYIGDPVSDSPPVDREKLEEIFQDIQADLRFDHELNGCLNCGIYCYDQDDLPEDQMKVSTSCPNEPHIFEKREKEKVSA